MVEGTAQLVITFITLIFVLKANNKSSSIRGIERNSDCLSQRGFTLIELLTMMVIVGVMSSVGVKKLDLLSDTATKRALQEGAKELNIRE
jgi:prepilin-type N-terminal cleavage/methylation domain-containing protein